MTLVLEPAASNVAVTVTARVRHLCPFKPEEDEGHLEIRWTTINHSTIELHSLRQWLDSFAEESISHEDLVEVVRAKLHTHVLGVSVEYRGVTAGMEVRCSTSPTLAG